MLRSPTMRNPDFSSWADDSADGEPFSDNVASREVPIHASRRASGTRQFRDEDLALNDYWIGHWAIRASSGHSMSDAHEGRPGQVCDTSFDVVG